MTITEFLLARIAEDEAAIPAGPPAPWIYATHPAYEGDADWHMSEHHVRFVNSESGYECRVADVWHEDVARHIARHDPARALAECEAKRRIVLDCDERIAMARDDTSIEMQFVGQFAAETLWSLAFPYANHADHDETWRP